MLMTGWGPWKKPVTCKWLHMLLIGKIMLLVKDTPSSIFTLHLSTKSLSHYHRNKKDLLTIYLLKCAFLVNKHNRVRKYLHQLSVEIEIFKILFIFKSRAFIMNSYRTHGRARSILIKTVLLNVACQWRLWR